MVGVEFLRSFHVTYLLRNLLGPKTDEVTGEWSTLHNEKLYRLSTVSSPNIILVIKSVRMKQACDTCGVTKGVYRDLMRRPEGKRLLGKLRRKWEENIEMDLQEVESGGNAWLALAQDRDI